MNNLIRESEISLSLCECPRYGVIQFDAFSVEYYRDVIRKIKVL